MHSRINQKPSALIKQVYPDSVNFTVEAKLVPDHPECFLFYKDSISLFAQWHTRVKYLSPV